MSSASLRDKDLSPFRMKQAYDSTFKNQKQLKNKSIINKNVILSRHKLQHSHNLNIPVK